MRIKNTPAKGYKADFAGFELDTSKIELHSSDKRNILLPYSGELPDKLRDNDGAYISINLAAGLRIGICLVAKDGKKERRYSVAAMAQEINDLLDSFFLVDKGDNTCHTRWDTGLSHFWLGTYQDAYSHWRRFVVEGHGMDGLIDQLSPEALKQVVLYIGEYGKTA